MTLTLGLYQVPRAEAVNLEEPLGYAWARTHELILKEGLELFDGVHLSNADPELYRFNCTAVTAHSHTEQWVLTLPDQQTDADAIKSAGVQIESHQDGFTALTESTPIVGQVEIYYSRASNLDKGSIYVWIEPHWRGIRLGQKVLEFAKNRLAEGGRRTITSWSKVALAAADTPESLRLTARDGSGPIDCRDNSTAAVLRAGFQLDMVERPCRIVFDSDAQWRQCQQHWQRLHEDARARAGANYEVVQWLNSSSNRPASEELARMWSEFSKDIPSVEGVEHTEYTAQMVEEILNLPSNQTRRLYTTAIRHLPSGELVAYTELVAADGATGASQEDTWVSSTHRGHRLGMLAKTANMLWAFSEAELGHKIQALISFNADSNTHMWAINRELGFERFSGEGAWKLHL